jgi:hypothetical protein
MDRRQEFLKKTLAAHQEYELATIVMRQMISEKKTYGPEWDVADTRQKAALEVWTSLLRSFPGIHNAR